MGLVYKYKLHLISQHSFIILESYGAPRGALDFNMCSMWMPKRGIKHDYGL